MKFKPFEDKKLMEDIKKEREDLIRIIKDLDIDASERKFIVRRITIISEKLLR